MDPTHPRSLLQRRPELFLIPLVFIVLVGGWEALVRWFGIADYILPPPSSIALAFVDGIASGIYLSNAAYTLAEALGGFLIAAVFGVVIGGLIAQSRLIEKTFYPYLIMIQTTPKIAVAPLLIIWFGFGMSSKLVIAATVAFFPILVNVIAGLRTIDAEKIELMRSLNASRWQIFKMARLPSALPIIFAGLNVAIVFSILGAIVGEFVGSKAGLGNLILQANSNLDTAGIFGVIACLAIMGIVLHVVMEWLQHRLVFWAPGTTGNSP